MDHVKVEKDKVLEIIRNNRNNHRNTVKIAEKIYREDVIAEMEKNLSLAKSDGEIRTMINLQAPRNMTEEYDTVIAMLEMSTDHEVVLTQQEFQQYVMDKWHWKAAFDASTSMYLAKRR